MFQCPDCDSMKIFSDSPEGDGKCAACHGSGCAGFFDAIAMELLNAEPPLCEECQGTGRCSTCNGTGVLGERELRSVA